MMASEARMFAQFGSGTVSVGCNKLTGPPEQWYIKITETKKPVTIGQSLTEDDILHNQEIILTFPTKRQMIEVMAAFTDKLCEEVEKAFDAALEASLEWRAI